MPAFRGPHGGGPERVGGMGGTCLKKKAAKNNIGAYIKKALGDTMPTYTRRQSGKLGPFSPVLKVLKNNCIYKELIFYGALEYWTKKVLSSFQKRPFSIGGLNVSPSTTRLAMQ